MLRAMSAEPAQQSPPVSDSTSPPLDFSAQPSSPRANRVVRVIVYLLLLALACAAIYWIDRGALLTNTHP